MILDVQSALPITRKSRHVYPLVYLSSTDLLTVLFASNINVSILAYIKGYEHG